ncbi:MAG: PH domain-containing protein [Kineosporiaceae bacterium]
MPDPADPAPPPSQRPPRSPRPGAGPGGRAYRPGSAPLYAGAYGVLAGWWLVALVVRGAWSSLPQVAAGLGAGGCLVFALLWRPHVRADAHGVLLANVVRDVAVPWPAVEEVRTRFALTVVSGGRSYAAWAAPARGGSRALRPSPARRPPGTPPEVTSTASSRLLEADSGAVAFLLEGFRAAPAAPRPGGPEHAAVGPAWPGILALALALVLGAAAVALG